jgi:SAM-dependent methyltransferase
VDASDWDERYRERPLVWSAEPNVFVERELGDLPPGRALDLAAGEGRNARWLASLGWDVEAVEFSPAAIEKGRALAEAEQLAVRWRLADLLDEPALEPADLVLIAYLQLPRPSFEQVLRHAAAAVVPGGVLLLVGHALRNLEEGVGGPQDPEVLWTEGLLRTGLTDTALVVERLDEVTRAVETEAGPRRAIDLLLRAHRPADGPPPGSADRASGGSTARTG